MVHRLRLLDDAAWVSVNDDRVAGASELWPAADAGVCGCEPAWLVVEAFVNVGVDGRRVDARATGRCIECGTAGTTTWLPVGRLACDGFRPWTGLRTGQGSPVSGGTGEP